MKTENKVAAGVVSCGIVLIIIVILTTVIGTKKYFNSGLCNDEETCVRENIIGEWAEDDDGNINRSGCFEDADGGATCLCKQQYGGVKCDVEVCTEDIREKCNGGLPVPVDNIGEEEKGKCIVTPANSSTYECVCNPGYKSSGGSIECNVEKGLIVPELDENSFKNDSVYEDTIYTENTCESVSCNLESPDNVSSNLSTALLSGRLLGKWTKKYGTGHILNSGVYRDKVTKDVMDAIVTFACNKITTNADNSDVEFAETSSSLSIPDIDASVVDSIIAEYGLNSLTYGYICSMHNFNDQPHRWSLVQNTDKLLPRTEVPFGRCVFDDDAVSRSSDGSGVYMRFLIEKIKYLFVRFEGYNDDYGNNYGRGDDDTLIFGPITPTSVYERYKDSVSNGTVTWETISNSIKLAGLKLVALDMSGNVSQRARLKVIPEELIAELCMGCWTLSSENVDSLMNDDEDNPTFGQSWQDPIVFQKIQGSCKAYGNDHYSKWEPMYNDLYCESNPCTVSDCCTNVAGDLDRCNEINGLEPYNYCSSIQDDNLAADAFQVWSDYTPLGAWVSSFYNPFGG